MCRKVENKSKLHERDLALALMSRLQTTPHAPFKMHAVICDFRCLSILLKSSLTEDQSKIVHLKSLFENFKIRPQHSSLLDQVTSSMDMHGSLMCTCSVVFLRVCHSACQCQSGTMFVCREPEKQSDRGSSWINKLPVYQTERMHTRAWHFLPPLAAHANLTVSTRLHKETSHLSVSLSPLLPVIPFPLSTYGNILFPHTGSFIFTPEYLFNLMWRDVKTGFAINASLTAPGAAASRPWCCLCLQSLLKRTLRNYLKV